MRKVPEYADVFSLQDFIEEVRRHNIMDYDGLGYFAKENEDGIIQESNCSVWCNPKWLLKFKDEFTHVCWYGK